MNLYLKEFLKNFLFGGTLIGIYSLLVKFISPTIAGQAAGSLPIMFTYIIILTYLNNTKKKNFKYCIYFILCRLALANICINNISMSKSRFKYCTIINNICFNIYYI